MPLLLLQRRRQLPLRLLLPPRMETVQSVSFQTGGGDGFPRSPPSHTLCGVVHEDTVGTTGERKGRNAVVGAGGVRMEVVLEF